MLHIGPYITSIRGIRLRLSKLQESNPKAKKFRKDLPGGWKDVKDIFYYQGLPYVPKIIYYKIISRHHDNPLVDHFGIKKTRKLIARKYLWLTLHWDIKVYVKGCDVYLAFRAVRYKLYKDLQSLLISTHCWKDLFIGFLTGFPLSWVD